MSGLNEANDWDDEVEAFVPTNDYQKNILARTKDGYMSVRHAANLLGADQETIQMAIWGEIRQ